MASESNHEINDFTCVPAEIEVLISFVVDEKADHVFNNESRRSSLSLPDTNHGSKKPHNSISRFYCQNGRHISHLGHYRKSRYSSFRKFHSSTSFSTRVDIRLISSKRYKERIESSQEITDNR